MDALTTKEMQDRLGIAPTAMKGLQFIMLDGTLWHPADGGWEAYPRDDVESVATDQGGRGDAL